MAWIGGDDRFQEFIDRHGLTFPQISDDPGEVFFRFGVPYQPAMAIVDTDGTVQQFLGAVDDSTLDDVLTELTS